MKFLLDTHIWVWLAGDPRRLSRRVVRVANDLRNELYLSPISIWEAKDLHRLRRIKTRIDFESWVERSLTQVPVREAPFTFEVARECSRIYLEQPDPADLIIAATAATNGFTLITADHRLAACKAIKVLINE